MNARSTTIPPSDGQGKVTGGDSDEMRAGFCRLSELWRQPALLELVEPIQGGDFVGLAQRGVVENCVPKILNTGAQREYDLADVHDFRRPVADDVDAQKLKRVRVEKQLQKTLFVTQHLSLGQLRIAG